MQQHPKAVGDRTTLAVMLVLESCGFRVYLPFSENTRCDLVLDDGVRLARVQCKTGRLRDGAIRFKTCSTYAHHPHPKIEKRDYLREIDYFAVYCHEPGGVYLVPIGDVRTKRQAALRVERTRNRQRRLIRSAVRYQVGHVVLSAEKPTTAR